jgi:hypothetical protein
MCNGGRLPWVSGSPGDAPTYAGTVFTSSPGPLGYHLKTGHTLSVQDRPTGLAEDVIVLPCCSVRLQGLGLSPRSGV